MKRTGKFLSITLALALIFSLIPTTVAFAEDPPITYEDIFPDENFRNIVFPFIEESYPETLITDPANGDIIVDAFSKITVLDVSNKEIYNLSGLEWFTKLVELNVSNNYVTELPGINSADLLWFDCSNNMIAALPLFPSGGVEYFNCNNNQITALPELPGALEELHVSGNNIRALPALPPGLTVLDCSDNQISVLPEFPGSLSVLDCSNNQISVLPGFPGSLTYLNCSGNLIAVMPGFPESLEYLDCSDNQISVLPTFTLLYYLDCSNNNIEQMPIFPGSLLYLDCSGNSLTGLPYFPDGIEYIDCSDNELPALPYLFRLSSLTYLDVRNNQIDALPSLPGTILDWRNSSLEELWSAGNKLGDPGDYLYIGNEFPAGVWNQTGLPAGLVSHDIPNYVIFDPNGGSRPSGSTTEMWVILSEDGTLTKIPDTEYTNPGYYFAGWFFNGNIVKPGDIFTTGDRITALWRIIITAPIVPDKPDEPDKPEEPDETENGTDGSAELPFEDVSEDDWYYDVIKFVFEHELMVGMSEDSFQPKANCSRGMIVTVLYRLAGKPSISKRFNPFIDVNDDSYYSEAVQWAAENGIATGYGDAFGGDDPVTREQLVTFIWRYSKWLGIDVSVGEDTDLSGFKDASDVREYAVAAFQWACSSGIIFGKPGGYLDPHGTATRAEFATILYRFVTLIEESN